MNLKYIALIFFAILIIPSSIIGMEDEKNDGETIEFTRSSFGGGNGTLGQPFLISNYTHLVELSANTSAYPFHFLVTNDIDASASNDGGSGFDPIGDDVIPFTGYFDGDNHTISDLWINLGGSDYIGLFGKIINGNVTNLELKDVNIIGRTSVGPICGWMENTWITNCQSSGSISASLNIGGIVGVGYVGGNKIIECDSDITISFNNQNNMASIGGLVGYFVGGDIINCSWDGSDLKIQGERASVRNAYYIGGLVGYLANSNVIDCYSEGKIEINGIGNTYKIGGLIGHSVGSTVLRCYSEVAVDVIFDIDTGSIYNIYEIGGLVGYSDGFIKDCYWEGSILHEVVITILSTGTTKMNIYRIGGLVGYNYGPIENSYSTTIMDLVGHIAYVGGFVGENYKEITNSYTTTSSIIILESIYVGRINAPIYGYDSITFGVGGFIGKNERGRIEKSRSDGTMTITSSSTRLLYNGGFIGWDQYSLLSDCESHVDVTLDVTSYSVELFGGLVGYKYGSSSGHMLRCKSFGLIDIELIGSTCYYIGGLIGYNDQINVADCISSSKIEIYGSGRMNRIGGLIGQNRRMISGCSAKGSIDLSTSYVISGDEIYAVGGLIGNNYDTVQDSRSDVTITYEFLSASSQEIRGVGGLIGVHSGGTVDRCFSDSFISASNDQVLDIDHKAYYFGGFVGHNYAGIKNSYSEGSISVTRIGLGSEIGGFVGRNQNKIEQSYSTISLGFIGTTESHLGGFVGFNYGGSIFDCYSIIEDRDPTTSTNIGGFGGTDTGTIESCFHDEDESQLSKDLASVIEVPDDRINGSTTQEMMKEDTFTYAGWDFNTDNGWGIIEGETYPWLFSIYHRPIITITNLEIDGTLQANEDDELIIDYTVTYSPYPLNIRKDRKEFGTDAPWLTDSYNDVTFVGRVSGTPINEHVGDYTFDIRTRDTANEWTNISIDIEVVNVNDNPQIINDDVTSVLEDEPYSYTYYAIDVDPILTEFSWSLQSGAFGLEFYQEWLTIESNTLFCTISGTPPGAYIGDWWVNVTVFDAQGGYDFSNFTLTVLSSNDAPVISLDPVPPAFEDKLFTFDLKAFDEDDANHTLEWEKVHGPSWLQLIQPSRNMPAQLRGTPNNDEIGTGWVEIMVSDVLGASDRIGFIIDVKNTNDAPEWVRLPEDMNSTEGDTIILEAFAEDIDLGSTLSYEILSEPASSIQINQESGAIKWLSAEEGNYTINVTVSDGEVLIWHIFNINVSEIPEVIIPENIVPIIENISDQEIDEGKTLVVQVVASDIDGDPIFYSIVDEPEGMVISGSGRFVWTPFQDDVGNHTIVISVSDGKGTATKSFTIWVKDVQDVVITDPEPVKENGDQNNTGFLIVIGILAVLLLLMIILFFLFITRKKEKKDPKHQEKKEEKNGSKNKDDMLESLRPEKMVDLEVNSSSNKKNKPAWDDSDDIDPVKGKGSKKMIEPAVTPAPLNEAPGTAQLPAPAPVNSEVPVGALPPSKEDDIAMAPEPKMEEDVKPEDKVKEVPVEEKSSIGTTPEPVPTVEKAEKLALPEPKLEK